MVRYVAERLALMIPTLIAISVVIFGVVQLPPGDYLSNKIIELKSQGEAAAAAKAEYLKKEYALDKPFIEQYGIWIGVWPGAQGFSGLLQGNWGWSFEFNQPVRSVVGHTLLPTIAINVFAVFVIYLIALPLGMLSAVRKGQWTDNIIAVLVYAAMAIPGFLLALVLLFYANRWFGIEIGGLMDQRFENAPFSFEKAVSVVLHMIVPITVIAAGGAAAMIRRLRANLLDELERPYVAAARARGLSERHLLIKYPLRMSFAPFIADIGNLLPSLISGSVIVSVVLSLPTVGPVLVRGLQSQDTFLSAFILFFVALLTVVGMLISDLMLAWLDPRVRLGQGAER